MHDVMLIVVPNHKQQCLMPTLDAGMASRLVPCWPALLWGLLQGVCMIRQPERQVRGFRTGCRPLLQQGSLCSASCSMDSSASLMTSTACVSVSMSAGQHMASEFGLPCPASGWSEPCQSPPEGQCCAIASAVHASGWWSLAECPHSRLRGLCKLPPPGQFRHKLGPPLPLHKSVQVGVTHHSRK